MPSWAEEEMSQKVSHLWPEPPGLGRVREARAPNGWVWPPRSVREGPSSRPGEGSGAAGPCEPLA